MKNKKLFILIGIFWLVIIIGFIASKEFTLRTGEQVLLKTIPVDPRDLFRGDYIILGYEIGTLDLNNIPAERTDFQVDDKIYVSLKKENGYGIPLKVYKNMPRDEKLFLKGRVTGIHGGSLAVEYGIESYFIPEGKGVGITAGRGLSVKVSIDKFGNVAIKSLLKDGREVSFK